VKITDLDEVNRLHTDLAYWQEAYAEIKTARISVHVGLLIVVTDDEALKRGYAPEYCDDVLIPLIKARIERRLEQITNDLRQLGVVIPQ
jgi:hypothetical protein